jgi:hypothetical protein
MLALGVIRVLVLLTGDTADESATVTAIDQALHSSLGSNAIVSMRRAAGEGEETLAREAESAQATLLCVVAWSDGQRRATIRFLRSNEAHWSDREIRFDPKDAATERARTVGFALASMVPDEALARHRAEPRSAPPPIPQLNIERAPAPSPPTAERPSAPEVPRPPGRHSIELAANGAVAVGGSGGGLGGSVAVRLGLSRALSLRFGAGGRVSELGPAQATSRSYFAGPGIAWTSWLDRGSSWGLGGRLDVLLLGQHVVHLSGDDPAPDHQFRILPGAAAALEGTWRFAEQAAAMLALGTEAAFGSTDIVVRGRRASELVPVRPFVEAGLRVSF